ncbi:hypothetical protein LSTR_LSTR012992 [Laodelphax striatellus]|uniref:Uncharacterized protein n=1 Tax=Laodelphax striatellus TaxID=195883 RepID=A0A482XK23_LAOST|nr:hypothetical protein LSTR_LSTR012992 [Laodelphax striatellus]
MRLAAIQVIDNCGLSVLTIAVTACQALWQAGKPAIIGFALSFIMWQMVLLNSNIPGIDPPTPFTPKKLRARKSPRYHLDYIFAVIIGLLTTFSLVVREMIY